MSTAILSRRRFLILKPWLDYAGESRLVLAEINRTLAPCAEYKTVNIGKGIKAAQEYGPTPRPSRGVWEKVLDWDESLVELQPGDYAVRYTIRLYSIHCRLLSLKKTFAYADGYAQIWEMQFRCGDPTKDIGHEAQVMGHLAAITCTSMIPEPLSSATISSGPKARNVAKSQSVLAEKPTSEERAKGESQELYAVFDRTAIANYYKVYWEKGPDDFTSSRSERAGAVNDMILATMPSMMNMLTAAMTEEEKRKMRDSLVAMGLGFDPDLIMNPQV